MPRITDITPQKREGRMNVFLDEKFWTGMPSEVVDEWHLRIGGDITAERKDEIEKQIAEETAFASAMMLLSYRDRSISEMRKRLTDKKFGPQVVEYAIQRMLEYGYLDDNNFARELAQSQLERGKGRRAAQSALYKAGLDAELINEALDETYASEEAEMEAALVWLSRKKLPAEEKDRQRLLRGLAGRGFSFDVAREALNHWESDSED